MNFICAWPSWFCLPLDILIIIPLADTKVKRFSRKSHLWRQACYKKLYFIVFCFLNGLCFVEPNWQVSHLEIRSNNEEACKNYKHFSTWSYGIFFLCYAKIFLQKSYQKIISSFNLHSDNKRKISPHIYITQFHKRVRELLKIFL